MTCLQQHSILVFVQIIVGGLFEKRKKTTTLFWASVINIPFCVRISIFADPYIVHVCIPVCHFIVIAVFGQDAGIFKNKVTTYTCLKRSHVTRTTRSCPGNSWGTLVSTSSVANGRQLEQLEYVLNNFI